MKSQYWIYAPAEYRPQTAAALMVFQDGSGYIERYDQVPRLPPITGREVSALFCRHGIVAATGLDFVTIL